MEVGQFELSYGDRERLQHLNFILTGAWWCMVVHGGAWGCMGVHGGAWGCIVMHGGAWWCMVLHGGKCLMHGMN